MGLTLLCLLLAGVVGTVTGWIRAENRTREAIAAQSSASMAKEKEVQQRKVAETARATAEQKTRELQEQLRKR